MKLSETLSQRGYVHQFSSETLEEITDGAKRTVYLGIDPSADSLHVGNLMGLLVLRHFLEDGHKVIILTGGGTGMIGDPGGKSQERNLLDAETVAKNSAAVAAQIRRVFGTKDFIEENNANWLARLSLLDFLRDIGKYFTVNAMIKKDIVRDRLEKESPISFTEFSYSLLQGYDYLHLNEEYGCDVQVGGSDQWTNILAGVEFIRRKAEKTVYAFTWPLIVNKSTGKKFGKSESGAVWLDPQKTSPFDFYQFFLNVEDGALEELLLKLTLMPFDEIEEVLKAHELEPNKRIGQEALARAVTTIVHGVEAAEAAMQQSKLLFSKDVVVHAQTLTATFSVPTATVLTTHGVKVGEPLLDVLVRTKLASSKREARQFIDDGAITLNGAKVSGVDRTILAEDFEESPTAILKRGKRNVCVLTISQ